MINLSWNYSLIAIGDGSFFQGQEDGGFSISLISVSAVGGKTHDHGKNVLGEDVAGNTCPLPITTSQEKRGLRYFDTYDAGIEGEVVNEKAITRGVPTRGGWLDWLCRFWF